MMEDRDVSGKNCPICSQQLPLSEFGVCRARKDGRNLYCKSCIRKKVTDSRRALKEYRSARKRYVSNPFPSTPARLRLMATPLLPQVTDDFSASFRRWNACERRLGKARARNEKELRKPDSEKTRLATPWQIFSFGRGRLRPR